MKHLSILSILAGLMLMMLPPKMALAQCIELEANVEMAEVLCSDDTVILQASSGYDNYRWYYGFSDSNEGGTLYYEGPENTIELAAGEWAVSYWYVETDDPDCPEPSNTFWWDAWVFAPPAISHDAETSICPGDSALISSAFPGPSFFQWYQDFQEIPGANQSTHWVTEPGFYTLEVAYEQCPDIWLSSGVGPEFDMFTPQSLEIAQSDLGGAVELSLNFGSEVQWFFNGDSIEGANELTYIATEPGFYSASAIDGNGCLSISDEVEVLLLSTVASGKKLELEVFPNPFTEELRVKAGSDKLRSIRLFDLSGRLVLQQAAQPLPAELVLDVSELHRGIYLMESVSIRGQVRTVKVVKK